MPSSGTADGSPSTVTPAAEQALFRTTVALRQPRHLSRVRDMGAVVLEAGEASALLLVTAARSWAGYAFTTDTNTQLTTIRFTNNFYDGICSVEGRSGARWAAIDSFFTTNRIGQFTLALPTNYRQFRLTAQDRKSVV